MAITVIQNVKTDLSLGAATQLATSALGMSTNNLSTYSLPGEARHSHGLSFFFADTKETSKIIEQIYSGQTTVATDTAIQGQ